MKIENCTPHVVHLHKQNGEVLTIEASKNPVRVSTKNDTLSDIDGIPVFKKTFGAIENLPEPVEGTIYIVSSIVLSALNGSRNDCYVPDDVIRDASGAIIGAKALSQ
jgi:hypothetical protein